MEGSSVMTNGTEREQLMSLLFGGDMTLINLRCFRGTRKTVTAAEIAGQIRSALEQRNHTAMVSESFNDDAVRVDVRALVADLKR
jgi:hypothetical protein